MMNRKYLEIIEKGKVICAEEEINAENLAEHEALIETEASIISAGTELSKVFAIKQGIQFPVRPGYGCIGHIVDKGAGLSDFEIGDRVFYAGQHCSVQRFTNTRKNQWENLFKVPQSMDAVDASLACLVNIALSGPNMANVKLGDSVAVFGLGTIGLLAALLFQLHGARLIALDPVASRCERAVEMGLPHVLQCPVDEQVAQVMALTNQQGADIAVDAVGHSAVIENAIQSTAPYGEMLLLGSPRAPYTGNMTSSFNTLHMRMITLRGTLMNFIPLKKTEGRKLSIERNFKVAFDLVQSKKIDAKKDHQPCNKT